MPQSTNGSKRSKQPHSIARWTGADARRIRSRPPARSEWFPIRTTDRSPVESMKPTPPRSRSTVETSPPITCRNSASNVSAVERLSSPMARTMSASPACTTWRVSGLSSRAPLVGPTFCAAGGALPQTRQLGPASFSSSRGIGTKLEQVQVTRGSPSGCGDRRASSLRTPRSARSSCAPPYPGGPSPVVTPTLRQRFGAHLKPAYRPERLNRCNRVRCRATASRGGGRTRPSRPAGRAWRRPLRRRPRSRPRPERRRSFPRCWRSG
jgi:hypothetical protein